MPHGLIHNVPYLRLQGGRRALICDPAVGDIGAIIVCGRDIASVKATRQPGAPGSFRQHDYADSLYIGGFLNGTPQEYAGWVGEDFVLNTTGRFIVNATQCQINCAMQVQGGVRAGGDVQADQPANAYSCRGSARFGADGCATVMWQCLFTDHNIFHDKPPLRAAFLLRRHDYAAA